MRFFTFLVLLCSCASTASALPTQLFGRQFGQNGDFQEGIGVAVGPAGDVISTGAFIGSVDFGGQILTTGAYRSAYVARHSGAGTLIWARGFGGSGGGVGHAVAIDDSGNVFMGGEYTDGVDYGGGPLSGAGSALVKFDRDGIHLWSQAIGGNSVRGVASDETGNVIAVGHFAGTVDFGLGPVSSAGGFDVFVAKYDPAGSVIWVVTGGGAASDIALAVDVDSNGNVVVSGESRGDADFGGGVRPLIGAKDAFVAVFDSTGVHKWSDRFGATGKQAVSSSVAMDYAGNVLLAVDFLGTIDFGGGVLTSAGSWDVAVAKFDENGAHQWSAAHGGEDVDQNSRIDCTPSGRVMLTASHRGASDFGGPEQIVASGGQDLVLASYEPTGEFLWVHSAGGTAATHFTTTRDLAVDREVVAVTGNFNGTLSMDPGYLDARQAGGTDAYIMGWEVEAGYTEAGSNVVVSPEDPVWGSDPVQITFDEVVDAGGTTLRIQTSAPQLPTGYFTAEGQRYYELSTSATFTGAVEVCLRYQESTLTVPEATLELLHFDDTLLPPQWVAITTTRDTINNMLCGTTDHFSPFVLASQSAPTAAPPLRSGLALHQSVPNPFNPSTTIRFDLPQPGQVELTIYDVAGRRVRTLVQEVRDAGSHDVIWRGVDDNGRQVASGVYLYRLEAGSYVETRRMTLLK